MITIVMVLFRTLLSEGVSSPSGTEREKKKLRRLWLDSNRSIYLFGVSCVWLLSMTADCFLHMFFACEFSCADGFNIKLFSTPHLVTDFPTSGEVLLYLKFFLASNPSPWHRFSLPASTQHCI
mmetsp:Transcript_21456/g.55764  ORF Transcript_21456/g.55764 Transcript_21456/m.55764 type:complete len:123 (-) Transcript_21456:4-372(-)